MEASEFSLSEREFERIRARVYEVAGISLSDAKRTLVIARLSKVVRALRLPSFDSYLDYLDDRGTPEDAQEFINALTTNLTRFWREEHHFDHLVGYVGDLIKARDFADAHGSTVPSLWRSMRTLLVFRVRAWQFRRKSHRELPQTETPGRRGPRWLLLRRHKMPAP